MNAKPQVPGQGSVLREVCLGIESCRCRDVVTANGLAAHSVLAHRVDTGSKLAVAVSVVTHSDCVDIVDQRVGRLCVQAILLRSANVVVVTSLASVSSATRLFIECLDKPRIRHLQQKTQNINRKRFARLSTNPSERVRESSLWRGLNSKRSSSARAVIFESLSDGR